MKILITCDDYWHPGEVIEKGLLFLKEEYGHDLHFIRDAKDILTPTMLAEYPLFINAKMNQIGNGNTHIWFEKDVSELQVNDTESYVRAGGGFIALHAGNSYFWNESEEYCRLSGCAFVKHPPRCAVTVRPVKKHPITEGVSSFCIRDEHYEVDHLAEDAELLFESVSEAGGIQPAGYVRRLGKGRICALMPGHILSVFQNEENKKIIRQAIAWTIRNERKE